MSASSSATRTRRGFSASVMAAILAVAGPLSDRGGILYRERPPALVSQLAEELDSKPRQCGFESHRGHDRVVSGHRSSSEPASGLRAILCAAATGVIDVVGAHARIGPAD